MYTDFLRIVLEIINEILTYALPRNPEVSATCIGSRMKQPWPNIDILYYDLLGYICNNA